MIFLKFIQWPFFLLLHQNRYLVCEIHRKKTKKPLNEFQQKYNFFESINTNIYTEYNTINCIIPNVNLFI